MRVRCAACSQSAKCVFPRDTGPYIPNGSRRLKVNRLFLDDRCASRAVGHAMPPDFRRGRGLGPLAGVFTHQVPDRPATWRLFFEEVIRGTLYLGRTASMSLVFHRRIRRQSLGRFHSRAITEGVTTSLRLISVSVERRTLTRFRQSADTILDRWTGLVFVYTHGTTVPDDGGEPARCRSAWSPQVGGTQPLRRSGEQVSGGRAAGFGGDNVSGVMLTPRSFCGPWRGCGA